MNLKKLFIIITTITLICALPAGVKKADVKKEQTPVTSNSKPSTAEVLQLFSTSYEKLINNYVDEINEEKIMQSSIKGMLKPLDPYTVFLEGSKKDRIELLTKGTYGGIGIHIGVRRDTLIVLSPIVDSPAYDEGLMSGDKVIKIDTTSAIGLNIKQASKLIKGEIGTTVTLTLLRPSTKQKLEFTLTRGNIKVHDVPYAGIDENGIGYIKINKFSKNTASDFKDSLLVLNVQGLSGLVIDLRNNSGGVLRSALSILDYFTERKTTLLTTKGRNRASNRKFRSKRKPIISIDIPIAVMINKSSASASEIIAGVLQDLDRAIIIGEKSFGKGLVQSTFTINDTTKLKITTAKYYTPSGRLIQKMDYLKNGALTDGLDKMDSTFYTIGGREVKGGNGITPDVTIKPHKITPFVKAVWKQGLFNSFAAIYVPQEKIFDPYTIDKRTFKEFEKFLADYEFDYEEPGEKELKKLKKILAKQDEFQDSGDKSFLNLLFFWKKDPISTLSTRFDKYFIKKKAHPFVGENIKWIKNGLSREMARYLYNEPGRIRAGLNDDNVYQNAVVILEDINNYYDYLTPKEDIAKSEKESETVVKKETKH